MKTVFKNLPPILFVILGTLLFILYKASAYLAKQQEISRIQASLKTNYSGKNYDTYFPQEEKIKEENVSSKFVDNTINLNVSPDELKPKAEATKKETTKKPSVVKSTEKPNPITEKKPTKTASNPEGESQYYVIAGSFSTRQNAEAKLKEVKQLGFMKAKLVKFNSLSMFSVCLQTYPSENQAKSYSDLVKEKYKLDTIVKKGAKKAK